MFLRSCLNPADVVGQSLNPAVDMGQIEGAYVQGQGLFTIEETFWSQQGKMLTKGPGAVFSDMFGLAFFR